MIGKGEKLVRLMRKRHSYQQMAPRRKRVRVNRGSDVQRPVQDQERMAEEVEAITELGTVQLPKPASDIHTLSIIGQIEGHMVLPSQNKTTKYEHVIPQ